MQLSHWTALLALATNAVLSASLPIRIITFNIRYAATSLETNEKPWWTLFCFIWDDQCRQPHVIDLLSETAANAPTGAATIIAMQEVLDNQLSDIKSGLGSSWAHIGVARDDGEDSGEYSPILYRTDVLKLLYSETKWLSPTPDTVSYGWGAGSRRIVTIGVFEHIATGKRFIHANTHLDNVSSEARSEGIKVVVARIQAVQSSWGPLGVTLTGDFNSDPNGDAYSTLTGLAYVEDLWNIATHVGANQLTYTGFTATGISRIDFIWLGPKGSNLYSTQQVEILNNNVDEMFISDHRPVVGDITLL
ncbi:endonuclease/Exonuclease/phosphatase [Pseudomassariella vexata]|uniref:Endonuclease/Exonuclease/phosphatase n=1 Tax=Pseudomassariella vexata TaxID=1141098 RepID=A0A1Y2EBQ6_9PEZI|nr:endonuclease/Exonuclease/phosphatase [Pseudomassariella vexata]ORY69000.1 endonuclease/Exonuclease/phosphatase [Pseudomassariella vexata]